MDDKEIFGDDYVSDSGITQVKPQPFFLTLEKRLLEDSK